VNRRSGRSIQLLPGTGPINKTGSSSGRINSVVDDVVEPDPNPLSVSESTGNRDAQKIPPGLPLQREELNACGKTNAEILIMRACSLTNGTRCHSLPSLRF
jgi:hypothetical protein